MVLGRLISFGALNDRRLEHLPPSLGAQRTDTGPGGHPERMGQDTDVGPGPDFNKASLPCCARVRHSSLWYHLNGILCSTDEQPLLQSHTSEAFSELRRGIAIIDQIITYTTQTRSKDEITGLLFRISNYAYELMMSLHCVHQ